MLYKPCRVLAHFKEIRFLSRGLYISSAVGAFSVYKLRLRPEAFARGAIQSLVRAFINIPLLVEFSENFLNGADVVFVGSADKLVVGNVHFIPYPLNFPRDLVYELFGSYSLVGGFLLNLKSVLVRAGKIKYVQALHSLEAGDTVGENRLVSVSYMGFARSVGYCGCNIKGLFI